MNLDDSPKKVTMTGQKLKKGLHIARKIAIPAGKIGLGLLVLTGALVNTHFYIEDIKNSGESYSLGTYAHEIGKDIFGPHHRLPHRFWSANRHLFPWLTACTLIASGIHDGIKLKKSKDQ
jgi:hypothetical protein